MDPDKSVDPPSTPRRRQRRRREALRLRKKLQVSKQGQETMKDTCDNTGSANQETVCEEKRDGPPKDEPEVVNEADDKRKCSSLQNQHPESPVSQTSTQESVSRQQDSVFNSFGMETPLSQTTEGGQLSEHPETRSLPDEKGQSTQRLPLLPLEPTTKPSVPSSTGSSNSLLEEKRVEEGFAKILLQPRDSQSYAWQEYLKKHGTLDDPILYDDPEVVLDILSSASSSSISPSKHRHGKSSSKHTPYNNGILLSPERNQEYGIDNIDSPSSSLSEYQTKANEFEHSFKVDIKVISSPKLSGNLKCEGAAKDPNISPSTILTSTTSSLSTYESNSNILRVPESITNLGTTLIEVNNLHQPSEEKPKPKKQEDNSSPKNLSLKTDDASMVSTPRAVNIDAASPLLYQVPWLRSSSDKEKKKDMAIIQQKATIPHKTSHALSTICSKHSSSYPGVVSSADNQESGTKIIDNILRLVAPDTKCASAIGLNRLSQNHTHDSSQDSDTLFDGLESYHQRSLSYSEQSSSKYNSSSIDDSCKNTFDFGEEKYVSFDIEPEEGSIKYMPSQSEVECVLSYTEAEKGLSIFASHSAITSELDNSKLSKHEIGHDLGHTSTSETTDVDHRMLSLDSVRIFTMETDKGNENPDDQHTLCLQKEYENKLEKCKILIGQKETEISMLKRERDNFREELLRKEQEMWCGLSSLCVDETTALS